MPTKPVCIVVMGVSGCGKSTIGEGIANGISATFKDADELHPQSNIDRMSQGIALTDTERWPWLDSIRQFSEAKMQQGQSVVIACSALKASYRQRLSTRSSSMLFVYLKGSPELIRARQSQREGHFMPASLIDSQFATLESPEGQPSVVTVDIDQAIADVISQGIDQLQLLAGQAARLRC